MDVTKLSALMSLVGKIGWLMIPVSAAFLALTFCMLLDLPNKALIVIVVFLVALAICLAFWLLGKARGKSKARGLESGMAGAGGVDHQAEVEALRKKWRESLEMLKKSGLGGGGGGSFAALPWYVIIGEPASGKSTLLRQSGIDFPIGDAALRGLQGTRNCDWWFSNVGIFLDTAGRYMSDESAEEWKRFLDLVRKQRTGAPVNGVIIAVPAPDLVSRDPGELDAEARRIRSRLDELIDRLGINFPVWVVLTKVDLLGGFAEFFGRVDAQARQRLMGWTLGPTEGLRFDRGQFDAQFEGMAERLYELRPQMVESASLRQRHVAFGFPDEVAGLGQPLGTMLQRMFEPNVFQETPFFRGLYVTSATQEGTPLQQAVARVRERFGAEESDAEPTALVKHAFFVEDFVKERIVVDRDMTWTTKTEMARGRLRRIGMNLVGCSLPVMLLLAFLGNWKRADGDLKTVTGAVEKVKTLRPVDASAELCEARQAVTTGKLANFGLNAHWMLRRAILDEEKYLLHEGILGPLFQGYRDRFQAASKGDLPALWRNYREFRAVCDAFRKVDPSAPPPKPAPPAEGEKKEGAPPPPAPPKLDSDGIRAGCEAPIENLSDADRGSVAGLWEVFAAAGLVDRENKDGREAFASRLLGPVSRLGLGKITYTLPKGEFEFHAAAEMERVEKAFRESMTACAANLVEEMKRAEEDRTRWQGILSRRIEAFQSRCGDGARAMAEGHADADQALEIVRSLKLAATGESGGAGPEGAGVDLAAVLAALKDMEATTLLPKEEVVAAFAPVDRVRLESLATGKGQAGADPKKLAALVAVGQALADLEKSAPSIGLSSDDVGLPRDLQHSISLVETRVRERQEAWVVRVRPFLVDLSGLEKEPFAALQGSDPRRCVEAVHLSLWRDALYQKYLESTDPGSYGSMVSKAGARLPREASTATDPVYTVPRLRDLATEVFSVVEFLDKQDPPGAVKVREGMKAVSLKAFQDSVRRAKEYWVGQCLDAAEEFTRRDSFSAQKYLSDTWGEEKGKLARFSEAVKKALKEEWAAGGGAPGRAITEGRTAAEELRRSFEFFWDGYPDVRASLLRLVRSARIAKDARDSGVGKEFFETASDIREGLTATGERSWSANVEQVRNRLPVDLGRLPADLERAVGLVRADLEAQMEGFFTDSWTGQNGLKEPVAAAVAKPGEGGELNFPPEFREFLKSLKELFGKELRGTLGKLRVTEGFKKFVREVETFETEKKALNVDGVEVTFVARQVPRAAQGFPYMVMEYSAKGEEPVRSLPFAAGGEASSLPITWKPSQAQSLKIFLLDDKKQNQKLFRSWAGSDCVPRAIVEAQTTGSLLKWESKVPELSGDSVGYEVQCAADGLERLIRFSKASEKPEVPDRVLETGSKE